MSVKPSFTFAFTANFEVTVKLKKKNLPTSLPEGLIAWQFQQLHHWISVNSNPSEGIHDKIIEHAI